MYFLVQTAVDKGSHLIAEFQVTNHNTDQRLLEEIAQSVKESLDTETVEVVADKDYDCISIMMIIRPFYKLYLHGVYQSGIVRK